MLNLAKKLNNSNLGRRVNLTHTNENSSSFCFLPPDHYHKKKLNSASVNGVVELPAMRLQFNPSLSGFRYAKEEFGRLIMEGNRELEKVWNGHPESITAFRAIFPELVQTRGITRLQEMDQKGELFNRWNTSSTETQQNEIKIEMETEEDMKEKEVEEGEEYPFVSIGGPSTYAAILLFKLRHPEKKALHIVTDRFDSNHDGSAYYYHERDAMPVYVNRVNRGPYCVYVDLKKRLMPKKRLLEMAIKDRHHVKISLNWRNITLSKLFTIFLPNVYHMLKDLYLVEKKNSPLANLVRHASSTRRIVDKISSSLSIPRELLLLHRMEGACYVGLAEGHNPETHFTWLNKFVDIPFHSIPPKGFGKLVEHLLTFPNDGCISPFIFENIKSLLTTHPYFHHNTTHFIDSMKLKKLIVRRQGDLRVKKLVLTNLRDNKDVTIGVEKLVASLGPSASFRVDTLGPDELDKVSSSSATQRLATKFRYYLNRLKCLHPLFRGNQVLKESMWAAGSTSVIVIGIRLSIPGDKSRCILEVKTELFRKFLDGVNQHFTPISERLVHLPNNFTYRFFALQMTGGGNFPSRFTRPDVLLNLLHTTEHLFGLKPEYNDNNDNHNDNPVDSIFDDGDIMYDIIQVRGCGRSVSATNSITFAPLASNAVINYALGGIGMTTMFPNAELSLQLLENVEKIKKGTVKNFASSTFGEVENPLQDIDYSMMIDDPNLTARMLGVNTTVSTKETLWLTAIVLTTTAILFRLFQSE